MRTRLLKPETFKDEDLADLSMAARVLFFGLWTLADKLGRLEDRPRMIRAEIFPYEPEIDVDSLLSELAKVKPGGSTFLTRYESNGCKCIQLTNFLKHQKPHPREADSTLPAPSRAKASQGLPKVDLSPARRSVSVSVSDTVSVSDSDTGDVDEGAIDRLDADIAFEEKRFTSLALPIRDTIQQVLDSLPRSPSRSPFSASHWLRTGLTGISRKESALTVLRLTNDALEARQRAQAQPYISDKTKATFDTIDRVLGTGAYAGMAAIEGGKR